MNPIPHSFYTMGFKHEDSGIAAAIFLALYSLFSLFMIYVIYKKGFKTVYSWLITFPVIRFGSQLCGMVFAIVGIEHYNWLIAYLVLGAEGYFVLILAAFNFVVHAQKEVFGRSWATEIIEPLKRFRMLRTYSAMFHSLLIPANAMVIAGGTMLSGESDLGAIKGKVTTSKALRTVGQVIFLVMTSLVVVFAGYVYKVDRIRKHFNISVLVASPFLIVRGIFGILSIYIEDMNYFQFSNYSGSGINHNLVIYEYVLSTTMEFMASILLLSNFFMEKYDGLKKENSSVHSLDQYLVESDKA